MREIGGYIELDSYELDLLHDNAIALNCGRNALAYILKSRGIKKIKIPFFICESIPRVCDREGVLYEYYNIDWTFAPKDDVELNDDEWIYIVNYYGQLDNSFLQTLKSKYGRIIVDNAQSYFQMPVNGVDTLYTCRKYFGVADGAFLYSDVKLESKLDIDESYNRMNFLLGRYERCASEFYEEYVANNKFFSEEPIMNMSKLTHNLLQGIDYEKVEDIRRDNFNYLDNRLNRINRINIRITGTYMYPLMLENGSEIRIKLQKEKIYIPTLWPNVFDITKCDDVEYKMAQNILPIPIDQRYSRDDMEYIIRMIENVGGIDI